MVNGTTHYIRRNCSSNIVTHPKAFGTSMDSTAVYQINVTAGTATTTPTAATSALLLTLTWATM